MNLMTNIALFALFSFNEEVIMLKSNLYAVAIVFLHW